MQCILSDESPPIGSTGYRRCSPVVPCSRALGRLFVASLISDSPWTRISDYTSSLMTDNLSPSPLSLSLAPVHSSLEYHWLCRDADDRPRYVLCVITQWMGARRRNKVNQKSTRRRRRERWWSTWKTREVHGQHTVEAYCSIIELGVLWTIPSRAPWATGSKWIGYRSRRSECVCFEDWLFSKQLVMCQWVCLDRSTVLT